MHMGHDESTRDVSTPILVVGICVALLTWLVPLVAYLSWDGAVPGEEVLMWCIVWPLVYGVGLAFSRIISRALDLKTAAWAFGAPNGPAPRWAHLSVQLIFCTGLPATVLFHMVIGLITTGRS